MRTMAKKSKTVKGAGTSTIITNKKARHDFFIEDRFEAGLVLEGWEVKSLRAGKVQVVDSYVFIKDGEAWVTNLLITPLPTASTHIQPQTNRTRKLLLHRLEIARLQAAVDRKGYTLIALSLYWKFGRVKAEIGLAKGKQDHDKRSSDKERDWKREKQRILKHG